MNLKHQFLLAMPGLGGDYFANTLTYICEHNKDGAMGIIINRPSDMSLMELLAQVGLPANHKLLNTNVFEGGPVAVERGMVLHSSNRTFESSADLGAGLCLSTAMEVLAAIANDEGPDQYLVALGYAGWGEGQLEDEIANNVWLTAPADQAVLFESAWQDKLTDAADLLGINLNLIAAKPGHA
jgi:putative transcriptional regulator